MCVVGSVMFLLKVDSAERKFEQLETAHTVVAVCARADAGSPQSRRSEDLMLNTQLMRNGYSSGTIVTVDGGSVLV